jgi:hypothetical protein
LTGIAKSDILGRMWALETVPQGMSVSDQHSHSRQRPDPVEPC